MQVNTKYFGEIDYDDKDMLYFEEGIFGFGAYRDYILIHFEPDDDSLLCLQSIQDENLAFVLMNPFYLNPGYTPELSKDDMDGLDLTEMSAVTYYVICVVHETADESTVNLKCPLIIKPASRHGRQAVLENKDYTFRHALKEFNKPDKEETHC